MAKNYTLLFRAADRQMFDDIKSDRKTVETRAATIKYKRVAIGDTLTFVCGKDRFEKIILKVHHWKSVNRMLKDVRLTQVMPGVSNVEEMKRIYASYPGYEEKIRDHGLVGFEMA